MQFQYIFFMSVNFMMFLIVSIALIPIAYVVGIVDKVKHLRYLSKDDQRMNYGFFIFGLVYLLLDLFADIYYFWHNNFRAGLKKIIIEVEDSTVSHKSLREIDAMVKRFSKNKIKSISTKYFLKHFAKRFNVIQNIQYLIFDQEIPIGGFKEDRFDPEE